MTTPAASERAPPKSILKKTSIPLPESSSLPIPRNDQERRRLDIAIQHARLIQNQKDVQNQNLASIEELSDIPASSTATEQETARFTSLVMSFQPSDYDALIEERHANNRCGYTLCANPPRRTAATKLPPWLKPGGAGSGNWCGDDCAKRALYVKAQLDETPAWERRGGATPPIVLYDERKLAGGSAQAQAQARAAVEQADEARDQARQLALERGEGKVASFRVDGVMTTEIFEKSPVGRAEAPELRPEDSEVHGLIEGYRPRGKFEKGRVKLEDDDDDDDDDDGGSD